MLQKPNVEVLWHLNTSGVFCKSAYEMGACKNVAGAFEAPSNTIVLQKPIYKVVNLCADN